DAEAGYHIQTKTVRLVPGSDARSSVNALFVQTKVVRPTANGPVRLGSVISVPCSQRTIAINVATPKRRITRSIPAALSRDLTRPTPAMLYEVLCSFKYGHGRPSRSPARTLIS